MAPKVAIVFYSMYGHIKQLAEAEKRGIEAAGGSAEIFQIAETLPAEVLEKMHAPPKSEYPVAQPSDLLKYDAILFGIPTRYGNFPSVEGLLGPDWWNLDDRRLLGQVCRFIRFKWNIGWWPGIYSHRSHEYACSPWFLVPSSWL
jgi:hypothetical protein